MEAKATIVELMRSCYGGQELLAYAESEDGIAFKVPAAVVDPQTAAFRSTASILNELAIGHRLAVTAGRDKYPIQREASLAIKSIEAVLVPIDPADGYRVEWHAELTTDRAARATTLEATLVTKHGTQARRVVMLFNVLPPSLVSFVRRTRKFTDYAEFALERETPHLATIADGHVRYFPSEGDRLSDGQRVDHVPALTLIDIALSMSAMAPRVANPASIAAGFHSYTDPREPLDILVDADRRAFAFRQNDRLVAEVGIRADAAP